MAGGQVHYAETITRPSDMPVVLLHQSASSWLGYVDLIEQLASSHWVIALDTPGFGNSDPIAGPVTIEEIGQVLSAALVELDIGPHWLFGHHTGASIAAYMAAHNPTDVKRLILSGPPVLDEAQRSRMTGIDLDSQPVADGSHLVKHWNRHLRLADGNLDVAQRELNLFFLAHQPALTYDAVLRADIQSWLEAIRCPTLVIGGENDSIRNGFEPAVALLSDVQFELLPDQGIYVADEIPDLIADRARSFFVA